MLKIVQINGVPYGSTAQIAKGIGLTAEKKGFLSYNAFGYSYHPIAEIPNQIKFGGFFGKAFHLGAGVVSGFPGIYSTPATLRLLSKINKIKPDIIHLHNVHGWFLNLPLLFRYIKKNNIQTVWTLHDCWSFTGHCPYFDMVDCEKWKTACYHCPQYKEYPQSLFDNSKKMHRLKKKWFSGVKNLTIVTPSQWLADLVKESFLKQYPIKVIHNGIDLNVFKPTPSDFREKYNCQEKFILLGVSFGWGKRKGLDVFIELAKQLDDRFQIVLVGTDKNTDALLPDNIISIHRTQNQKELAEIYSAADLFVNPTREENYPTVNMESIACGTPVLTFRTGGSPEIPDETCGSVVPKNDVDGMVHEILRISEEKPFSQEACLERAKSFDMQDRFKEYIELYEKNSSH